MKERRKRMQLCKDRSSWGFYPTLSPNAEVNIFSRSDWQQHCCQSAIISHVWTVMSDFCLFNGPIFCQVSVPIFGRGCYVGEVMNLSGLPMLGPPPPMAHQLPLSWRCSILQNSQRNIHFISKKFGTSVSLNPQSKALYRAMSIQ